jgi:hypothetical protein
MSSDINPNRGEKAIVPFSSIEWLRQLAQKLHQRGDTGDAQALACAIAGIVLATGAASFYGNTFLGGCPACGDCEEVLRIGQKGYAVCHEHRAYWYIGVDRLLAPEEEKSARRNQILLASYTVATTAAFSHDPCPCCGLSVEHAPWCMMPGAKRA